MLIINRFDAFVNGPLCLKRLKMRFKDKVVLVTGSSRNTGLGIAECFLEEGARVCLHGSSEKTVHQGGETLRAKGFSDFIEVAANLADPNEIKRLFETILKEFGRLDVLVNNAVVQCCGYDLEHLPYDTFMDAIKTNLAAPFLISQYAVGIFKKQKSGVIVHFSSNVSERAIRNRTAYCASKAGIDGLTRSMALDLAPFGIRVNAVAPGYINTDRWETLSEEYTARRRKNTPLGHEATAKMIGKVVLFFASDDSLGITGQRLTVDGGCTIQLMPADVDV